MNKALPYSFWAVSYCIGPDIGPRVCLISWGKKKKKKSELNVVSLTYSKNVANNEVYYKKIKNCS